MDALAGVRSYLQYIRQDYVVLAGGDLAVNLPLNDIFEAHIRNDADITAVCTSRPMGSPKDCDYFTIGAGGRITDVLVHPPLPRAANPWRSTFSPSSSCSPWWTTVRPTISPSFSTGVLQAMAGQLKICPYVFDGYAARLQSVAGYFARSMELLNPEVRTDLFAPGALSAPKDPLRPVHLLRPRLQGGQLPGG